MNKNNSVIVINGRHYDAVTGQPLAGQIPAAHGHAIHAVRTRPHEERRPEHHGSDQAQQAEHHAAAAHHPAHHAEQEHKTGYRPTRHISPHRPAPARTLMRQAVKKPEPSVKRRIKVQGHLGFSAAHQHSPHSPNSRIVSHRPAESYAGHTRNHAVKGSTGRLISHFSPELFAVEGNTPLAAYGMGAVSQAAARTPVKPVAAAGTAQAKPRPTTDELLEYAVHHAPVPRTTVHRPRRKILHRAHAH